jgi:hypothetical protein
LARGTQVGGARKMSYRLYRVLCATPSDAEADLENERQAFYEVVGQLNEAEAMPLGYSSFPSLSCPT